jgi:hypothetical protein
MKKHSPGADFHMGDNVFTGVRITLWRRTSQTLEVAYLEAVPGNSVYMCIVNKYKSFNEFKSSSENKQKENTIINGTNESNKNATAY